MFYGKEEKIETGKRLKELRENYNDGKGISHEKLAIALNEKYSIPDKEKRNNYLGSAKEEVISIGVLKNYEITDFKHSKFNAGYGMNVSYLTMLADFYDVSTDYLLGRTDVKKADIDIQGIHEKTGLSDTAIENILNYKAEHDKYNYISEDGIHNRHVASGLYGGSKLIIIDKILSYDLENIIIKMSEQRKNYIMGLAYNHLKEELVKQDQEGVMTEDMILFKESLLESERKSSGITLDYNEYRRFRQPNFDRAIITHFKYLMKETIEDDDIKLASRFILLRSKKSERSEEDKNWLENRLIKEIKDEMARKDRMMGRDNKK